MSYKIDNTTYVMFSVEMEALEDDLQLSCSINNNNSLQLHDGLDTTTKGIQNMELTANTAEAGRKDRSASSTSDLTGRRTDARRNLKILTHGKSER